MVNATRHKQDAPAMLDLATHDAQIRTLYTTGTPSLDIARLLEMDLIDVVGRVRAMELQPPGMGVRRPRVGAVPVEPARPIRGEDPIAAPEPPAANPIRDRSAAGLIVQERPDRRPTALARPLPPPPDQGYEEDEDCCDDEPSMRGGRPRGWLMTEAEVDTLFARAGQRFRDAVFKARAA